MVITISEYYYDGGSSVWRETPVLIDDCDRELIGEFEWKINQAGYAYCNKQIAYRKSKSIPMHRLIAMKNNPLGLHVHHLNGNKLDNRRGNLLILKNGDHRRIHNHLRKEAKQCEVE